MKKGKLVLITGASRGIGFQMVKQLSEMQLTVYALIRNSAKAPELLELAKNRTNIKVLELDLSHTDLRKKIQNIFQDLDLNIDFLIHGAARIVFGHIETINEKELKDAFNTNFFSAVELTNFFLPYMRKRKQGHILFLNTTSTFQHQEIYPAYSATKAALESVAISLGRTLKSVPIHVTNVILSATNTDIAERSLEWGSALDGEENPYKEQAEKDLKILKHVLSQGESPQAVAEQVIKLMWNPTNQIRDVVTDRARKAVEDHFMNPREKFCEN